VPSSIKFWREEILNYVEHKRRFGQLSTNAFAEYANRQIKKAYRMGNGYRFEVLRSKVVCGGVLVDERPPQPLDKKWKRAKWDRDTRKGRPSEREANPNSNVARLAQALEEGDKTKGLLSDPKESPEWMNRFGDHDARRQTAPASDLPAQQGFFESDEDAEQDDYVEEPGAISPGPLGADTESEEDRGESKGSEDDSNQFTLF